ncbi:MAG: zf-HC2 domain-containing protein [Actinomycetota bacterium]
MRWAGALEGLLDDELDARAAERVLVHLENCPDCLGELEQLARLQRSLARLATAR